MRSDCLTKENICAVMVLYNPDMSVKHNITSFIDEVMHLYVIDNSEKENNTLKTEIEGISTKISFHALGENLGIAKALNEGCKLGIDDGYQWILTMDQDSFFTSNEFFKQVSDKDYEDVAILAASYNDVHFKAKSSEYPNLLDVYFVITSGNILNLTVWHKLNGFIDKLFIDEVDNEFCIRARNNGYTILTTKTVFLHHHLGHNLMVKQFFSGKQLSLSIHPPLRIYYMIRNNFYLWKKFSFRNFDFVLNRIKNIISLILKIIFYFPDKKTYFRFIFKAIKHSLKGQYGKFQTQ